jgi:hypothetical protein
LGYSKLSKRQNGSFRQRHWAEGVRTSPCPHLAATRLTVFHRRNQYYQLITAFYAPFCVYVLKLCHMDDVPNSISQVWSAYHHPHQEVQRRSCPPHYGTLLWCSVRPYNNSSCKCPLTYLKVHVLCSRPQLCPDHHHPHASRRQRVGMSTWRGLLPDHILHPRRDSITFGCFLCRIFHSWCFRRSHRLWSAHGTSFLA